MPNQRHRELILGTILALVALLLYGTTLSFPFLNYDDSTHILNNPAIRDWSSIPKFFGTDIWQNTSIGQGAYYRPLGMTMVVLRYKLAGFDPRVWHGTSVLLEVILIILLWRLVLKLTGSEFIGFAAALLFAVHPMCVESVAWISGISELLTGIFLTGGMLAFLHWRDKPTPGRQVAYVLLAFAGLLSKETAIALPMLIAIYQFLFPTEPQESGMGRMKSVARATWPLVLVVGVYAGMRLFAMHNVVHLGGNTTRQVMLTWPLLLVLYLKQMFWPLRVALFYDVQMVSSPSLRWFVLPLLLVVILGILTLWLGKKSKLFTFLASWWLLLIVPSLVGLYAFTSRDIFHDRFGYLSLIALSIGGAWLLSRIPSKAELFGMPSTPLVALLAVVLSLGFLTIRQVPTWSSDLALFQHSVEVSPNNVRARNLYSNQLSKTGNVTEAIRIYQGTLLLEPDLWETNFALGYTLATVGRLDESEPLLRKAVNLDARETVGYVVLAEVLRARGKREAAVNVLESGMNLAYNRTPLEEKLREIQGTVSIGK